MIRPRSPAAAFTLIELLVVVTIIALLASMLTVSINLLREKAKKEQANRIMQIAAQGLNAARAGRSGIAEPSLHPLAASTTPRQRFKRAAGGGMVDTTSTSLCLVGIDPALVAASHALRVLLPDDRFAETATPPFYGMERSRLGVLGLSLPDIATHIRASQAQGRLSPLGTLVHPGYTDDGQTVPITAANPGTAVTLSTTIRPYEGPSAGPDYSDAGRKLLMDKFIDTSFGGSDTVAELVRIGGLWAPKDDDPASLGFNRRVYVKPGALPKDAQQISVAGTVITYRLRGPALYDPWGREILYFLDDQGGIRFESAGSDGHFRWKPGKNNAFETDAAASTPTGDDRDASIDNPAEGMVQR